MFVSRFMASAERHRAVTNLDPSATKNGRLSKTTKL